MCLRGARELRRDWLARDTTSTVAVSVIWSPQLGAGERHVPGATTLVGDPRAVHYWDPEALVGLAFARLIGTATPAWDVWMLFDRDAMWRGSPPHPAWWEHQLQGLPAERFLDSERFAARARRLHGGGIAAGEARPGAQLGVPITLLEAAAASGLEPWAATLVAARAEGEVVAVEPSGERP